MPATTFTGYEPRFEMPIVARPPDGFTGDPLAFYQQLQVKLSVAISGPNGEFLDIALSNAGAAALDPTLFAMTGGFVRHYPPGTTIPSPDGFTETSRSVLMLACWIHDAIAQGRAFPADTPPAGRIYYVGVDATETKAILRNETARMSEAALRASWKAGTGNTAPNGTTPAALIDAHNNRVMAGTAAVFVDGGTPIGKAAKDLSATDETYLFTLRMTGTGPPISYISPLPALRGAPYREL